MSILDSLLRPEPMLCLPCTCGYFWCVYYLLCIVPVRVPHARLLGDEQATGIVEYASAQDAARVVSHVHGKLILGRPVTAWIATPGVSAGQFHLLTSNLKCEGIQVPRFRLDKLLPEHEHVHFVALYF